MEPRAVGAVVIITKGRAQGHGIGDAFTVAETGRRFACLEAQYLLPNERSVTSLTGLPTSAQCQVAK